MRSKSLSLAGIAAAGIAFVVLYVILGVQLWVSFLAGGGILAAAGALQLGSAVSDHKPTATHPVDVRALRARFALTLGLAVSSGFLIVASFAFAPQTVQTLGWTVGIGITLLALALSPVVRRFATPTRLIRREAWDLLAAAGALLGAWQIVQALVFDATTARWLTFADACVLAMLSIAALVLHESTTERVVHMFELVERRSPEREPVSA